MALRHAGAGRSTIAPETRQCTDCDQHVPVDAMKHRAPGRVAKICKACDAARGRERYWRDVDESRRQDDATRAPSEGAP